MTGGNLIDLAAHRERAVSEDAAARGEQRDSERSQQATTLLNELRRKKRIAKEDQPVLVRNLGRLVLRLEPESPMLVAQRILGPDHWPKRTRYIQFPNDIPSPSARHAASGGIFAGLIDRLVDENVHKGFNRAQAKIEIVHEALKGTSFRRPSRFRMVEGEGDAAFLVKAMERVLDTLAQDADLADYFELVSKYPICPADSISATRSLKLKTDREPNDLYGWDYLMEDDIDLQGWVPWWAPKCVIGHLYIPFQCNFLHLPPQGANEIRDACGGEITREKWISEACSSLVESFVESEFIRPCKVEHRLPVWLILLPSRSGLISCFYVSIDYRDNFQIGKSVADETYFSYVNAITPCFVDRIGQKIDDDTTYFGDCDDDENMVVFYVRAVGASIKVIGPGIDNGVGHFMPGLGDALTIHELPRWLDDYPVQRILKLTADSDEAKAFVLSPRDMTFRMSDDVSVFRPAFSDSVAQHTPPVRQNTIAAYLLRNFVDVNKTTIFEALKNDALAKAAAAREVIDGEISKFRAAFDSRYGK